MLSQDSFLNLSKSFSECENAIEEINTKKAKVSAELYEVRCKIANLQKITIFVYKDGTLCIENADTPDISESEYAKHLSKFFYFIFYFIFKFIKYTLEL